MFLSHLNRYVFKQNNLFQNLFRYLHDTNYSVLYSLDNRGLLKVSGNEARDFLQGLVTSDMQQFDSGALSVYAMFLNKKGRVLYDTLVHKCTNQDVFMVECDLNVQKLLQSHLQNHSIKKNVEVTDVTPLYKVWAWIIPYYMYIYTEADTAINLRRDINFCKDPRLPELGYRLIASRNIDRFDLQDAVGTDTGVENDDLGYKYLRYKLGVCEGAEDLFPGTRLPQEVNIDYLNGISPNKNGYIGQESAEHIQNNGAISKRIMPFRFKDKDSSDYLENGASILAETDIKTNVGTLKGFAFDYGLGLVSIKDALEAKALYVGQGQYPVEIVKPDWWPMKSLETLTNKPELNMDISLLHI